MARRGRTAKVHKGGGFNSVWKKLDIEVDYDDREDVSRPNHSKRYEYVEKAIKYWFPKTHVINNVLCETEILEISRRNQYFYTLVSLKSASMSHAKNVLFVIFVEDIDIWYDSLSFSINGYWEWDMPAAYDVPKKFVKKLSDPLTCRALSWRMALFSEINKKKKQKEAASQIDEGDTIKFASDLIFRNGGLKTDTFVFKKYSTFYAPDFGFDVRLPNFRKRVFTVIKQDGSTFYYQPS